MRVRQLPPTWISGFLAWSLNRARRRPILTLAGLVILGIPFAVAAVFDENRTPLLTAGAAITSVAVFTAVVLFVRAELIGLVSRQTREIERRLQPLEIDLPESVRNLEAALASLRTAQTNTQRVLQENISSVRSLQTAYRSERETLEDKIGDLKPRLESVNRGLESAGARLDAYEAARSELISSLGRLETRHGKLIDTLERSLAEIEAALDDLKAQSVSLDLVSVLRTLRPIWIQPLASSQPRLDHGREHGHRLMMIVLVEEHLKRPGTLDDTTLIEIGTTRERDPFQGSTQKLAIFTAIMNMRFVTVDMDPECTDRAERFLEHLNPRAEAVTQTGEEYLESFTEPIDYVYLDAFDFYHEGHSGERKARYREILQTAITDQACWEMHRRCAEGLVGRMKKGGIVVIDDTWTDASGRFEGKGKLAIPLLLENSFQLIMRSPRAVALQRLKGPRQD